MQTQEGQKQHQQSDWEEEIETGSTRERLRGGDREKLDPLERD